MKQKNKIILGTAGALVIGLLAGTYLLSGLNKSSLAQDAPFMGRGQGRPEGIERLCGNEDFAAIQTAIQNRDYTAWQELRVKYDGQRQGKGGQWDETIDSQEKFEKFADMKQLMEEGKFEEAQAIRQELGFPVGPGMGQGMGRGRFHN